MTKRHRDTVDIPPFYYTIGGAPYVPPPPSETDLQFMNANNWTLMNGAQLTTMTNH